MPGIKDILLGSRPSYALLPGMQDSINDIQGLDFSSPGFLHREAKGQLKRLDRGDDVSDMGEFASLRQQEATDLAGIDEDYSSGANVLNATGGGEQANQINAMRDRSKERRRMQTGNQYVQALGDLRRNATGTLANENATRDNNLLRQQQLLLQARSNVANNQRQGGILPGLIQGAAKVGLSAIPICWIARELWGEGSFEAELVRGWLISRAQVNPLWTLFLLLYIWQGERVANYIKTHKKARQLAAVVFDRVLQLAMAVKEPTWQA